MTTIDLGYRPRQWQKACHQQRKRFTVLALHRRAGKTELALRELLDKALRFTLDLGLFFYVAPQLKQSKAIAWSRLKQIVAPLALHGLAEINDAFVAAGAVVLGISRDSIKSHENFCAKQSLPFSLVSDPDETACNLYGVMKLKNMYGKQVRGIERSTFVIDAAGVLRREWRGVKVPGHAQEVLDYVKAL